MRKNKTAAAILALAITTSLAGCGNHAPTTTDKDTSSPSTVASEVAEGTTTPGENSSSVEASAPSTSAPEPSSASEPESTASKPAETTPESSATASQPAAPSKPEQTKPVETKPADKPAEPKPTTPAKPAEKPEETKPVEKPTDPKPEETPPVQPVQIADSREVEAKVAQYINQYRNTNAVVLPGLTQVARYRSKQLITNFSHDTTDSRAALAYFKYGEYIDMTEYGYPESANYYRGYNAEAIAKGNWRGTADEIGREIAKGFRNSEGHWSYLGSDEYGYTAVGCTYDPASGLWYCCICVTSEDYGG